MKREAKQMLWLDEPRGQNIPRDFALSFADRDKAVTGVSAEDWAILEKGPSPENENYWEAWDDVCRNAVVTDYTDNGAQYFIYQAGACWLVEVGAEWDETGKISETGWYIDDGESDEES